MKRNLIIARFFGLLLIAAISFHVIDGFFNTWLEKDNAELLETSDDSDEDEDQIDELLLFAHTPSSPSVNCLVKEPTSLMQIYRTEACIKIPIPPPRF